MRTWDEGDLADVMTKVNDRLQNLVTIVANVDFHRHCLLLLLVDLTNYDTTMLIFLERDGYRSRNINIP